MRDLLCKTKPLTVEQSDAIGREFEKHQRVIDALIRKHILRYGGNYEELLSRAMDTIIVAFLRHDPSRSELSKYLIVQVQLRLIDFHLEGFRKKHRVQTGTDELFQAMPVIAPEVGESDEFVIESLRDDLTPDAEKFLDYYLQDVHSTRLRSFRSRFRKDMLSAGWSVQRIHIAMSELEHMLQIRVRGR